MDGLNGSLVGWLIMLIDWFADCTVWVDWWVEIMINWLVDWLVEWLIDLIIDWLVDWFIAGLIWLMDSLIHWLIARHETVGWDNSLISLISLNIILLVGSSAKFIDPSSGGILYYWYALLALLFFSYRPSLHFPWLIVWSVGSLIHWFDRLAVCSHALLTPPPLFVSTISRLAGTATYAVCIAYSLFFIDHLRVLGSYWYAVRIFWLPPFFFVYDHRADPIHPSIHLSRFQATCACTVLPPGTPSSAARRENASACGTPGLWRWV